MQKIIPFIKQYFVTFIIFLLIDAVWLGFISKNFYPNYIGHLMAQEVNIFPALLFYVLYVVGIVYLVIKPSLEKKSLTKSLIFGALLGLVSYSTYDLTNLATLTNWPVVVTVVDIIWGTILTMSVSGVSYLVSRKL